METLVVARATVSGLLPTKIIIGNYVGFLFSLPFSGIQVPRCTFAGWRPAERTRVKFESSSQGTSAVRKVGAIVIEWDAGSWRKTGLAAVLPMPYRL